MLRCEACNRPMDSPVFCAACVRIYPADGLSFFELFGLPQSYQLDPAALRQAYLNLARSVHPDRIASVSPEAATASLRLSAQLNHAYETLADPLRRAEYLLELSGGQSAAEDKTVPQETLTEALLLREEIEEARAGRDAAALAALAERTRQRTEALAAEMRTLAERLPGDEALRRELRVKLNELRCFQRIQEAVSGLGGPAAES